MAMSYKAIKYPAHLAEYPRSSVGTDAWMTYEYNKVPVCSKCDTEMQLFLQLDVEERFGLPFKTGSQFVLFMCPKCNEIPTFEQYPYGVLPDKYWDRTERHFFVALFKPNVSNNCVNSSSLLHRARLEFTQIQEKQDNVS